MPFYAKMRSRAVAAPRLIPPSSLPDFPIAFFAHLRLIFRDDGLMRQPQRCRCRCCAVTRLFQQSLRGVARQRRARQRRRFRHTVHKATYATALHSVAAAAPIPTCRAARCCHTQKIYASPAHAAIRTLPALRLLRAAVTQEALMRRALRLPRRRRAQTRHAVRQHCRQCEPPRCRRRATSSRRCFSRRRCADAAAAAAAPPRAVRRMPPPAPLRRRRMFVRHQHYGHFTPRGAIAAVRRRCAGHCFADLPCDIFR